MFYSDQEDYNVSFERDKAMDVVRCIDAKQLGPVRLTFCDGGRVEASLNRAQFNAIQTQDINWSLKIPY